MRVVIIKDKREKIIRKITEETINDGIREYFSARKGEKMLQLLRKKYPNL